MINALPSNYANAVTPFSPLGSSPVGEESTDLKASSLKPLEASPESARNENRRAKDGSLSQNNTQATREEEDHTDQVTEKSEERQLIKDQQVISELAVRDREVRAHERAHASVGGQFAGAPHYEYTRGPDGVSYAVSGEVSISTGAISGDPEATIAKARQIKRAAAAPADPSGQDRRVMAQASQLEAQAAVELRELSSREVQETKERESAKKSEHEEQSKAASSKEERRLSEAAEERLQAVSEAGQRNVDISRRLIEIGAVEPYVASGNLINGTA